MYPSRAPGRGLFREAFTDVRLGLKRLLDIVVSASALVLCSPLIVLIAVAVRLDSPGPVVFSQIRVGQNRRRRSTYRSSWSGERREKDGFGREFRMYKFRSMRADSPRYATSPANARDSRITRVGRLLRGTSLDELPQLFNVLRGDMSLVGPRPEMPFIVATYEPIHHRRLVVKPGLTGLWQLWGRRDRPIHECIEWDLEYVENWSLRLDAEVLLETLAFVFRGRNY